MNVHTEFPVHRPLYQSPYENAYIMGYFIDYYNNSQWPNKLILNVCLKMIQLIDLEFSWLSILSTSWFRTKFILICSYSRFVIYLKYFFSLVSLYWRLTRILNPFGWETVEHTWPTHLHIKLTFDSWSMRLW